MDKTYSLLLEFEPPPTHANFVSYFDVLHIFANLDGRIEEDIIKGRERRLVQN